MRIAETTYTINQYGNLKIPKITLSEMGLQPGDSVRVAYLTPDGLENVNREFLLCADPLTEAEDDQHISVPAALLAQANIGPDADIQIICVDGGIVISQEPAMQSKDLQKLLISLHIASDALIQLSEDPGDAIEALRHAADDIQEGAFEYDNHD